MSGDGKDRSGLPEPDDGTGNGQLKHKARRIRKIFPAFIIRRLLQPLKYLQKLSSSYPLVTAG